MPPSAKKQPTPSPEPAPQMGERLQVIGLLDTRGAATEALRTDVPMVAAGHAASHPLWPPEVREGNRKADLGAKAHGIECASCGHIRRTRLFHRISTHSPVEYDAACQLCRALMDKAALARAQTEHRTEHQQRLARNRMDKQRATEREKLRRRGALEANRERVNRQKRTRMIFREGTPEAQREYLGRELCRRRLCHFVERFEGLELVEDGERDRLARSGKGFHVGWFQDFCLRKLQHFVEDVVAGREPRLMLFTPPRHGKSTMGSRMMPSWALGNYPELEIIAASYGSSLPMEFSRFVRALLRDRSYRSVFPNTRLLEDKTGLTAWGTTAGGQYLPAGVGTGISGRGADVFVIDDPVKDMDEADSEVIQVRNLEWYLATAQSRLSPRCGQVIIQTRWSDNDISGYLERGMLEALDELNESIADEREHILANVPERDAQRREALRQLERRRLDELELIEQWEIVRFPAMAIQPEYLVEVEDKHGRPDLQLVHEPVEGARQVREPGDPLHPERYTQLRLKRTQRNFERQGKTRIWQALYQQQPSEGASLHFKREYFQTETPLQPHQFAHWTCIQVWDPAIGEKQQNDWTVGGTAVIDPNGRLHVLHVQRFRGGAAEIARAVVAEYAAYEEVVARGVYAVGLEHGQISMALDDSLERALEELNEERVAAGKAKLSRLPLLTGDAALKPVTDKLVRSRPSQGMHRSGLVYYPLGAPWLEQFIREHLGFMAGYQWDDCVDYMSWTARTARKAPTPRPQEEHAKRPYSGKYKNWRRRLQQTYQDQGGGKHFMGT